MSKVAIYLNFQGTTENAFLFYKSVFGTEFSAPFLYIKNMPANPNGPKLSESDLNSVMHVALPIINGTEIMGTDILESMGHKLIIGNNTTISLHLDTKEEADKLYGSLSEGSTQKEPLKDEFWGYWGTCLDKFGVRWMFNVYNEQYQNK